MVVNVAAQFSNRPSPVYENLAIAQRRQTILVFSHELDLNNPVKQRAVGNRAHSACLPSLGKYWCICRQNIEHASSEPGATSLHV